MKQDAEAEGPLPLGGSNDIVWFAHGRVAVALPRTESGGVDEVVQQIADRYERVGKTLALAIVITSETERPGSEMSQRIQSALDEVAPMVACTSITILGTGFFASYFLSFIGRVLKLTKRGHSRQRIHTSLIAAAAWMHEQLNDPDTSEADILETLRWATGAEPLTASSG